MERPILTHLYNYDEICAYLRAAQKEHPDIMQLTELAHTEEGRAIWNVTLSKGNPDANPALYVGRYSRTGRLRHYRVAEPVVDGFAGSFCSGQSDHLHQSLR